MSVACEPELMPSFPRYRNMKRKSSAAAEEKTKPKADFGGAFGEPVSSVLVSGAYVAISIALRVNALVAFFIT